MDFALVTAVTVHALSMVVVLGYYGILGLVVLPTLRRSLDAQPLAEALVVIEQRARPLFVLSIAGFAISGIYLTFADEQYAGLGNVAGSTWTALILLKHLVVALLIGLGIVVDRLIEGLAGWAPDGPPERSVRLVGLGANAITVLGAVVIAMTAAAQFATT